MGLSIYSCSDAQKGINNQIQEEYASGNEPLFPKEFSESEEQALDALDKIQISGWKLYSTFPNQNHYCENHINTFKITKIEFKAALLQLLNQHYTEMTKEERTELATLASEAQKEYTVQTCSTTSETSVLETSEIPPRKGMWIFQALLSQRDLIIKW